MSVRFTVPGEPMSKARARVVKGHAYTPEPTVTAEINVRAAFSRSKPRRFQPFAGPLAVTIDFYAAHKTRRDIDNMAKLVLDALNKHAWVDDFQIQQLYVRREYVSKGTASTFVTIIELPA